MSELEVYLIGAIDEMEKQAMLGLVSEEDMEKEAILGRIATGLMAGRSRVAGGLSSLGKRLGTGTGRFSGAMDRMSTNMFKRKRALDSAVRTRRAAQANIANLKSDFRQRAGSMSPSARNKARESLQKKITKEKTTMQGALGQARQKQGLVPKPSAPAPTPQAPTPQVRAPQAPTPQAPTPQAPAPNPAPGQSVLDKAKGYLSTTPGKVGAGVAIGAGATYAATRPRQQQYGGQA